MKPWGDLTETGKIRRLRPLAERALEQYPVEVRRIRSIGGFSNILYRVDTSRGPLALRVDYQQDHSDENVAVELAWLEALANETDLDVARVVPARSGDLSVSAGAPGVPGERHCVLFEWIPGRPLDDDLSPERYHQFGRLAAGIHQHGATFDPPHQPMVWDKVFYWPPDIDPVVIWDDEYADVFDADRRRIIERALAVVEPAFSRLEREQTQIIHGDLHPSNVHVSRSRMIAFDFEDVAYGLPVQDIAITLFYNRTLPEYPELRAAFEEGYSSVAPWPVSYQGELERFMAARTVMFINYVAHYEAASNDYFDVAFPRLDRFLTTWE